MVYNNVNHTVVQKIFGGLEFFGQCFPHRFFDHAAAGESYHGAGFGKVYVDGSSVGAITDADLKDRRILAEEGFISVIVVVDSSSGAVISGPEIHSRGFAEDDAVFNDVKPKIEAALAEAAASGVRDSHALSQVVRRTIGRWVNQRLRRRPMIVPLVIEA